MSNVRELTLPELVERSRTGDRRALGRLITLIERNGSHQAMVGETQAYVLGVTGPPGAGKSTLVGLLASYWADRDERVAVLAVDPSSPLTGGAILGDRIRMHERADVFVRSMATRGHAGGLALAVPAVLRALSAAGFTRVIVETVGVGQAEVEIAGTADTTAVIVVPGLGDAIQANKAGLLELADIFVVNKCDRPGADDVRRDLELMLDLDPDVHGRGWRPPIVLTNALSGQGVADLASAVDAHLASLDQCGLLIARRAARARLEIEARLVERLAARAREVLDTHGALIARVERGEISASSAADEILVFMRTMSA